MLTATEYDLAFTKAIRRHLNIASKQAIKDSAMAKIFRIEHDSEYTQAFTSTEGITGAKYLKESENLVKGDIKKGYKTLIESQEFGEYITTSYQERLKARDNKLTIAQILNDKKNSVIISLKNFMEQESHKILNDAFTGNYILAPDGQPLISATHKWKSSDTTRSNLLTGPLTQTLLNTVTKVAGAFKDARGIPMPMTIKTIVVKQGGTAFQAAERICGGFTAQQLRPQTIDGINIYDSKYRVIETAWMDSDTSFFLMADHGSMNVPNPMFVNVVDAPHMFDLQTEKNLDFTYPVAGSFGFGLTDLPFTIFGSQG